MLFHRFCIAEPFGTHHSLKGKPSESIFILLDFGVIFSLGDIRFPHIIVGLSFLICLRFSALRMIFFFNFIFFLILSILKQCVHYTWICSLESLLLLED